MNTLGINKPNKETKVVVAMSGGVDSSVVAALMKQEGYDVTGITLKLYDDAKQSKEKNYLTQAENLILFKLFSEKSINKKSLERDVLDIKQDLNSSSIESHLNRIRKKLKKIHSDFSVSSKNNNVFLETINPDR